MLAYVTAMVAVLRTADDHDNLISRLSFVHCILFMLCRPQQLAIRLYILVTTCNCDCRLSK